MSDIEEIGMDLEDINEEIGLPVLDQTQREALTNLQKAKDRVLNEFIGNESELNKITIRMRTKVSNLLLMVEKVLQFNIPTFF